jgi:hypothetical protein
LYPAQSGPYGGLTYASPPKISFHGGNKVYLADEDMDTSDRHDEDTGWVISSRNPLVILRDDGEGGIVEDTPDGDGVADACEDRIRLDP